MMNRHTLMCHPQHPHTVVCHLTQHPHMFSRLESLEPANKWQDPLTHYSEKISPPPLKITMPHPHTIPTVNGVW